MPTIQVHKAPFGVDVLTIDGRICLSPADLTEMSDLQLMIILRWWQGCGDETYERDHMLHNLGYDPQQPSSFGPGVVYFVRRSDGLTKIGYSRSKASRFSRLREQHGPLEILAEVPSDLPHALEAEMHEEFAQYRVEGEWFNLPEEEIELVQRVLELEQV